MPWTWVRPTDPALLAGRPLLDIGCGDAQTLAALAPSGMTVGLDANPDALRAARRTAPGALVAGDALALPFVPASVGCVLAADLFHHIQDLAAVLLEIGRVLRPEGVLVAWWYATAATPAPDAPRHPRPYEEVAAAASGLGPVTPLELEIVEGAGPVTGLVARRRFKR